MAKELQAVSCWQWESLGTLWRKLASFVSRVWISVTRSWFAFTRTNDMLFWFMKNSNRRIYTSKSFKSIALRRGSFFQLLKLKTISLLQFLALVICTIRMVFWLSVWIVENTRKTIFRNNSSNQNKIKKLFYFKGCVTYMPAICFYLYFF